VSVAIFSAVGPYLGWYYTGVFPSTTVQYCPVLRYAQVLLMDAEAQINLGNYPVAQGDLNLLLTRRGAATVSFSNSIDGFAALQSTWQAETPRQGDRFVNLVRWGTAPSVLGPNGYHQGIHNLLPVPQILIMAYPGMNQNPGY